MELPDWEGVKERFASLVDEEDHWEKPDSCPKGTYQIWRAKSGKIRYKASFFLPVPSTVAADLLWCISRRCEWDTLCAIAEEVGQQEEWKAMYVLTHPQWPASAREEVIWVRREEDLDGRILLLGTACEHPEWGLRGAGVRMRTAVGGQIITPCEGGCVVLQLLDSDPCGALPSFIVRQVSTVSVPKNITKIREILIKS